jgi:flagellar hook-associated protein 3 FlgL
MIRRIAENQVAKSLLSQVQRSRVSIDKYSREISTGLKTASPGDTQRPATINQFQSMLTRFEKFETTLNSVKGSLMFQDDTLSEAHDILARAQELATSGANDTNSSDERKQIATEVLELREALMQLANSTYQGKYVWNGTITNVPPFSPQTYIVPATGNLNTRYSFDSSILGSTSEQSVSVSDQVDVRFNSRADKIWSNAISAVERLARALSGYESLPAPPALPDGTGAAYTFPADFTRQSQDIRASIDLIKKARESDIQVERVSLGGRMERLEVATSLINLSKGSAKQVLAELSEADITESASKLSLAQTNLEASLTLTSRILNLSVLDYL